MKRKNKAQRRSVEQHEQYPLWMDKRFLRYKKNSSLWFLDEIVRQQEQAKQLSVKNDEEGENLK